MVVSLLNTFRGALEVHTERILSSNIKAAVEPILKAMAACVTLGTGNSLGPEGPSVEIGASVAKMVGSLFDRGAQRKLSLRAAGSAAGISSGWSFLLRNSMHIAIKCCKFLHLIWMSHLFFVSFRDICVTIGFGKFKERKWNVPYYSHYS